MRMVVSKKTLSLIRLEAVEGEAGRQREAKLSQAGQGSFAGAVAVDFKLARAGDADFDLVAFLEVEDFDYGGRQADCETVSPLRDLHGGSLALRWIYTRSQYIKYESQRTRRKGEHTERERRRAGFGLRHPYENENPRGNGKQKA